MFRVKKIDRINEDFIQRKIDQKTKPIGALGQLEELAKAIALILSQNETNYDRVAIINPTMLVFAADHGVAKHGVSIAPSEVTGQMVNNFLKGGAAINCFCEENNFDLKIVDAGIMTPFPNSCLIQNSLGKGTSDFTQQPAMSMEQVDRGLSLGKEVVNSAESSNLFGFGEMGIGNSSAAAALFAAISGHSVESCVGVGTGIDNKALALKKKLVTQALQFHQQRLGSRFSNPMELLASFGGFEIVQIVGGMLAAAEKQSVILVDGFIATIAAIYAVALYPESREYMIFSHESDEKAHKLMLKYLDATPLLHLSLRLGEGTGAALAMPLVKAAVRFYNDMASFESAGVTV